MCKCKPELTTDNPVSESNIKINTIHLILDSMSLNLPSKMAQIEKLVDDLDGISKHITELHKLIGLNVKKVLERE